MPRGDQTGPLGQGPRTGRGMGYCSGFNAPGFMNPGFCRGRRFGRRFGWRNFAPIESFSEPVKLTKEEQKKILKEELNEIEQEKKEIEKRLKELK